MFYLKQIKDYFDNEIENYILWLPIFFIIGIIIQFSLNCYSKIINILIILLILLYFLNNKFYYLKIFNLVLIFILLGYCRTFYFIKKYNYNVIQKTLGYSKIYGVVEKEIINKKYNGEYVKEIIVKVENIKVFNKFNKIPEQLNNLPYKLKIRLKNNENIYLSKIILTAFLVPIEDKYFKSDFDLKRLMYFQGIGGIGYGGEIIYNENKNNKLSIQQKIDLIRNKVADRIINVRKDSKSTDIIAILLTGQKSIADKQAIEYMNYSGLAHLLSVSGLHMMTLIILTTTIIKWLLLRTSYFALHYNVFKISATISLIINFLYLLLSGMSVSAVRAYLMSVILLLGIIIGRFNHSLRSVMFTMFIIIFARPYFIFNAGFQMSFMAVIALISSIEYYYNYKANQDKTILTKYFSNKIFQYFILGFITSFVAECATTPFSIYNFNNYSFYNVLVNSFLTPLVSFIVLPLSMLSILLYVFNIEWLAIIPASYVMDIVLYISKFITEIPNSVMFIRSPNIISMFFMIFGLLWFCLWHEKWRRFGIILYIIGLLIIPFQKKLDVVIDNIDKMLIFIDNDKTAYIYNSNEYKIKKITMKLGITKYYDLNDKIPTNNKIIKNNNIIIFIKNGKVVKIDLNSFNIISNFNLNVDIIDKNKLIKNY